MIFTEQVLYSKTGYKNMFTENNRLIIGRLPREMCKTDVPLLCMETSYLPVRRFLRSLVLRSLDWIGLDETMACVGVPFYSCLLGDRIPRWPDWPGIRSHMNPIKNRIHSTTDLPVIITFCISFSSYIGDGLLHLERLAAKK